MMRHCFCGSHEDRMYGHEYGTGRYCTPKTKAEAPVAAGAPNAAQAPPKSPQTDKEKESCDSA